MGSWLFSFNENKKIGYHSPNANIKLHFIKVKYNLYTNLAIKINMDIATWQCFQFNEKKNLLQLH